MIALMRKELRQLLAWVWLVLVFEVFDWSLLLLTQRLDELTWLAVRPGILPGSGKTTAIGAIGLGFAVGMGMFPREYDEGTAHFLRALPVSPRQIVGTKVLSGLLFLTALTLVHVPSTSLQQAFNPQSFYRDLFNARTAAVDAWMTWLTMVAAFSHGVLLSLFRRFGLLVYGLAWVAFVALKSDYPVLEDWSPDALLDHEYVRKDIVIPWGLVARHLLVALAALGLGSTFWLLAPEGMARLSQQRLQQSAWGRFALRAAAAAIVGSILAAAVLSVDSSPSDAIHSDVEKPNFLETAHYHFSYRPSERSQALELAREADGIYERIAVKLGLEQAPVIVADLTERSSDHAGLAGGHKLRMRLSGYESKREALGVLAHETTHVLAGEASRGGLFRDSSATWSFSEGLAEHLQFVFVPGDRGRHALISAGRTWAREQMRLTDLLDQQDYLGLHAEELVYPLGRLWAESWERACGPSAFAQILREGGRQDFPRALTGLEYWREVSVRIGCPLEEVSGRMVERLEAISKLPAPAYDRLPSLVAHVEEDPTGVYELVVEATPPRDATEPDTSEWVAVVFRRNRGAARESLEFDSMPVHGASAWGEPLEPEDDDELYEPTEAEDDDDPVHVQAPAPDATATDLGLKLRFEVPEHLWGGHFEYQLSVSSAAAPAPLFQRWRSAKGR